MKNILSALATAALTVSSLFAGAAEAGTYGYGENYFEICNETHSTEVWFTTDETDHIHKLGLGECDTIWTNWDYITIKYDWSLEYGMQYDTIVVNYPNDVSFINYGYNEFGEVVHHQEW